MGAGKRSRDAAVWGLVTAAAVVAAALAVFTIADACHLDRADAVRAGSVGIHTRGR
jgi:hypothetical protein